MGEKEPQRRSMGTQKIGVKKKKKKKKKKKGCGTRSDGHGSSFGTRYHRLVKEKGDREKTEILEGRGGSKGF